MLRCRIIPSLLVHKGGLVKTVNFNNPKYVGDPLNAVRIFNEKEVDEIIVLDIDASVLSKEPDYELISDLAGECRMPLCYGGGVKTADQVEKIVGLGVEKVAISSAALLNPSLVSDAAQRVGNQSIVVVLDVKKVGIFNKSYGLFINNGKKKLDIGVEEAAIRAEEMYGEVDKVSGEWTTGVFAAMWQKYNIGVLANTKEKAAEVKVKLKEAGETKENIAQKREIYRDVATRGSILYFAVVEMS